MGIHNPDHPDLGDPPDPKDPEPVWIDKDEDDNEE
jgi:hypothetical protein